MSHSQPYPHISSNPSFPPFLDAFSLLNRVSSHPRLSFGCEHFDSAFDGGLLPGCLYEISGEAGSGKTQLAMQLMLNTRLPVDLGGFSSCSLYLNCESDFPVSRLSELASVWERQFSYIAIRQSDFLDSVLIENLKSVESLVKSLFDRIPLIIEKTQAKLLIIDSIGAIFRGEEGGNNNNSNSQHSNSQSQPSYLSQRSEEFFRISSQLKRLAAKFQLVVVILNQVTDSMDNENSSFAVDRSGMCNSVKSSGRRVVPALGLAWSNCIETRIFLTRTRNHNSAPVEDKLKQSESEANFDEAEEAAAASKNTRNLGLEVSRQMLLMFSPSRPRCIVRFRLSTEGIRGISRQIMEESTDGIGIGVGVANQFSRPANAASPVFGTPQIPSSVGYSTDELGVFGSNWIYPEHFM